MAAQAAIHDFFSQQSKTWMPACAGMTRGKQKWISI
jgi:hypothetical protein